MPNIVQGMGDLLSSCTLASVGYLSQQLYSLLGLLEFVFQGIDFLLLIEFFLAEGITGFQLIVFNLYRK